MPKKNGGRFIPCRGGGTATTYYTDEHNVDEDMMTIIDQGGSWFYGIEAGVMERHLNDFLSLMTGEVASRLIYLS